MHRGFTIRDALAILPYLHSLGVGHVYTSSLLAARPGSVHGYDVLDHSRLNPELGTEADLAVWVEALRAHGMGLILDVVPNHMCVNGINAWWADVLENGPSSPFANHFDIAWSDHPRERLHGKVLLPILGDRYGKMLESGEFKPEFEGGAFHFRIYESKLPIDPRTYGRVLNPSLDEARVHLGAASDAVLELQSILMAVSHLPPRNEPEAAMIREGRYEIAVIKRRLSELCERSPEIAAHIHSSLSRLVGTVGAPSSFTALDEWLEAQAYRPAFWRVASDEINYRRFFDINDLAAISTEREEVFEATHAKVFEWLATGVVDGLRIDHPDGLYDPKDYLDRLQLHYLLALARRALECDPDAYDGMNWDEARTALAEELGPAVGERLLYVVVEKILGAGEKLPADWRTHGTTGYEFLAGMNALFVEREAEAEMSAAFERFTGQDTPYEELVYRNKFLILQASLAGELHVLAHQLDRLAQMDRVSRDFTLNTLRHALREVIACFPVYRSYIAGDGPSDSDRALILRGVVRARRRNALLGRSIFEFIRDTLLLKDPPSGPASDAYRAAQRSFAGKFQQVTAPVMAKGVEDTTFYVYNRLISLNEVGGEPGTFGATIAETHAALTDRAARTPGGMSPLATHDTKRGEDVRARIDVLSEMPQVWSERVARWAEMNRGRKIENEDQLVPDTNEEYLLYQTLVGAWSPDAEFAGRIREYMNKVVHEAKVHTSWINPDAEYDAAIGEFVTRILDPEQSAEFLADLDDFCKSIQPAATLNSLSQTLLRCTAPGVPDTYQGTEVWDHSLVDPDNRRPVDYARIASLLESFDAGESSAIIRELVSAPDNERAKLFVVSRSLRLRRTHPDIFQGDYIPLEATGPRREHAFAYLRRCGRRMVLAAVPRLMANATFSESSLLATREWWADTMLHLPEDARSRMWNNVWTDREMPGESGQFLLADLFAEFPVALLISE